MRSYPDPTALEAAMLAEAVDLPLGTSRSTSFDMAQDLQARWNGSVHLNPDNVLAFWPQLRNPTPLILADARFRRALIRGTDRQAPRPAFRSAGTSA